MEHWLVVLIVVALLVIGIFANRRKQQRSLEARERRRQYLLNKYGDQDIVADIMSGSIRQGMTYDMVIDSWGQPAAVEQKVYRTKTKEILKYGPGPRRSFAQRVTVEDGIVMGWENR